MARRVGLALVVAIASLVSTPAQAHESGYKGFECYVGYPDSWLGYGWRDCLVGSRVGPWYEYGGYYYQYVYGTYQHSWWGIPQYKEEQPLGYCWEESYCVHY